MKTTNFFKLTLLTLILSTASAYAQVTVGVDEAPADGALLQIKNKEGVTGSGDNSTKGLIFPRVLLTQKDKLFPMLAKADGVTPADNYTSASDIAAMNALHTGLTVYNTNTTSPFKLGLYTWNGTEWKDYGGDIAALNGLINNNQTIELGGDLTKATTITQGTNSFTVNAGTSTFGVNTTGTGKFAVNTDGLVVTNKNVSIGGTPTTNASLRLDGANQGFILPRVQLINSSDATTIPVTTADRGMVVYHIGSTDLEPGLLIWTGATWIKVITTIPPVPDRDANVREITQGGFILPQAANATDYASAIKLPFDNVVIPEDGTYAFVVRMAGRSTGGTSSDYPLIIPTFFYLNVNGTIIDGQTFYTNATTNNGSVGATIYLVARNCKAGDVVQVFGSTWIRPMNIELYNGTSPTPSRTSLVFWKL